jgi:putative ABC transport system permease protein
MFNSIRVGFFLANRQIKRAGLGTTLLIIFIMFLTFVNLIVVSGILIGLVEGSSYAYRSQYSGDVFIENLPKKNYILQSQMIINTLENLDEVDSISGRYLESARVEANYKQSVRADEVNEQVGTTLAGIDPFSENQVTHIKNLLIAGECLNPDDEGQIIVGSNLLEKYNRNVPGNETLSNVDVGDKVRINFNNISKEFIIKGVIKTKVSEVSRRVFLTENELRKLLGRNNYNVNEIAIKLKPEESPQKVKQALINSGFDEYATIQTWQESQGSFFDDISTTFNILSTVIGSIGLIISSITIFIVIFINAISKKKYIGILKGIGIKGNAIEISYVIQAIFYALIGSILGILIVYLFLVPYFNTNPIDFPFSDGILAAPILDTAIKTLLLFVATIIAGYIPARLVIKKNTLDAILGR